MLPARRSPHDREIVRLALPAFGALAAEPLYILVDTAIEIFFVYSLDLGIAGSAWGTVFAQYGAALAYVAITARSVRREHASVRPQAAGIRASANVGGRLVVRTGSLLAAFLAATAIASRIGDADVAAHQIAFQVFLFLGLRLGAL